MTNPRAYCDEITLSYGNHAVALRPSLRAAIQLERLHDGFPALLRKIEQFDTRTIAACITAGAPDRQAAQNLFIYAATGPLSTFKQATQAPVIELVANLLPQPSGAPDDATSAATGTSTLQPWAKAFQDLFGIATGWLGWTPDAAWSATPQEITDAFTAHIEKLKAIHGAADDDTATVADNIYTSERLKQIEEQGFDPAFDRAALHALSNKVSAT
ncbi:hypothetical protein [Oceaniovalibus sp. ACAM 378]|uniref:hypothetical protein n=1 Tax=Oceaniovalibus sp. ACAM 378 TaxID=2599923 RepID=UPI0011D8905A|nr:hypothetical protein [Oceaniovalibus sp. ACAM 378]TYB85522.1 hypothetical protein FQ320_18565 [Oceaniovalibus sp. ACAM 378]